jgi:GTPase involved in cell partitioning and DNA repair
MEKKNFIVDLSENRKNILVAKGGDFGKGNKLHHVLAKELRKGKPGEEKTLYF